MSQLHEMVIPATFPKLPTISGKWKEIDDIAPFRSGLDLLSHDSMSVYYCIQHGHDDAFTLVEQPTTTARMELLSPVFEKLLSDYGPEAEILDLACSPGYFMFKLARMGFRNISGVDARPEHQAQFNFLKTHYGFDSLRFELSDIYEFVESQVSLQKKYDICLLFGFLYHTSTPVELLEGVRKICRKCLVIDTTLSHKNDSSLLVFEEPTEWSRASTQKISLMPSLKSVPKLLEAAGFSHQERFYPSGDLKTHNPGGNNIDFYFDYSLLTKLTSLFYRILNVFGPKFAIMTKNRKSRRAIFCAYP